MNKSWFNSFIIGGLVGILGGLIGLGGAEFRLPLLVTIFGFTMLSAVIINKVISLGVVIFAIIFRNDVIAFDEIFGNIDIIINILIGSLIGAYIGADYVLKVNQKILNGVIISILLILSFGMIFGDYFQIDEPIIFENKIILYILTIFAGFLIGAIAAVLGVAGGEFIIPTLILLYQVEPKLAGSLSLFISLPTMLIAFGRYFKSEQFNVVSKNIRFIFFMIFGSLIGVIIGAFLLNFINSEQILLIIGVILLISTIKLLKKNIHI